MVNGSSLRGWACCKHGRNRGRLHDHGVTGQGATFLSCQLSTTIGDGPRSDQATSVETLSLRQRFVHQVARVGCFAVGKANARRKNHLLKMSYRPGPFLTASDGVTLPKSTEFRDPGVKNNKPEKSARRSISINCRRLAPRHQSSNFCPSSTRNLQATQFAF